VRRNEQASFIGEIDYAQGVSTPLDSKQTDQTGIPLRGILIDIALNAIIPWILYRLSKRYVSPSEFTALMIATTFPIAKSIFDVAKRRELDPVAVLVLLGIAASMIGLLAGGGPRVLLIRESLFTGVFGLACFASLVLPRPMMFYFGRHFMTGGDPQRRRGYDAAWGLPDVRFANRLITVIWGTVYVLEFAIRVLLIYVAPAAVVLVVSPILLGGLTIVTLWWTFRYARVVRERSLPRIRELPSREPA